jgi:hypothetical protein
MRTIGTRDCGACRYWSELLARAGGAADNPSGDTEAMCLAPAGPNRQKYTTQTTTCAAFAVNSHGAVDEPPNYGEGVRAEYARQAAAKHPNGAPMYAPDGTLLDEKGERSTFDDIDE